MKLSNIKKLFFGICGVMTLSAMFSACTLEPYELPQEELYLRSFIKKYGLINPDQDFNEAHNTEVTVILGNVAQDVNVYIKNFDRYYRVAFFANASGTVRIPIDVPQTVNEVYVLVGQKAYIVNLGATIDLTMKKGPSRAEQIEVEPGVFKNAEELAWILVAEDLGATDDFDFNDMIIRIEAVTVNEEAIEELKLNAEVVEWDVIVNDEHLNVNPTTSFAPKRSRDGDDTPYTKLRVTALAAGGTLPLYLHYQPNASNDYIVSFDYGLVSVNEGTAEGSEWHRWFNETNVKHMINTGLEATMRAGKTSTFVVDGEFSMSQYSRVFSNWYDATEDLTDDRPMPDYSGNAYSNKGKAIQGFFITVGSKTTADSQAVIAGSRPGNAPQMFLIPDLSNDADDGLWHWPKERVSIIDCYDGFTDWVGSTEGWWYNRMKTGADVMDRLPVATGN